MKSVHPVENKWALDTLSRLNRLGITKRQLAQKLNANYTQVSSVTRGMLKSPALQARIDTLLDELEAKGGVTRVQ